MSGCNYQAGACYGHAHLTCGPQAASWRCCAQQQGATHGAGSCPAATCKHAMPTSPSAPGCQLALPRPAGLRSGCRRWLPAGLWTVALPAATAHRLKSTREVMQRGRTAGRQETVGGCQGTGGQQEASSPTWAPRRCGVLGRAECRQPAQYCTCSGCWYAMSALYSALPRLSPRPLFAPSHPPTLSPPTARTCSGCW